MQLSTIIAIRSAIQHASQIMQGLILIRVIFSWLSIRPTNPVTKFVYDITELILVPIRNFLNRSKVGSPAVRLDFSPLAAMLLIEVINYLLISLVNLIAGNITLI